MNMETIEKYLVFRKRLIYFTVFSVEKEKIGMQICKNGTYQQPYSTEWHDYLKNIGLQIFPTVENPLHLFRKFYNMKVMQEPKVKAFKQH